MLLFWNGPIRILLWICGGTERLSWWYGSLLTSNNWSWNRWSISVFEQMQEAQLICKENLQIKLLTMWSLNVQTQLCIKATFPCLPASAHCWPASSGCVPLHSGCLQLLQKVLQQKWRWRTSRYEVWRHADSKYRTNLIQNTTVKFVHFSSTVIFRKDLINFN